MIRAIRERGIAFAAALCPFSADAQELPFTVEKVAISTIESGTLYTYRSRGSSSSQIASVDQLARALTLSETDVGSPMTARRLGPNGVFRVGGGFLTLRDRSDFFVRNGGVLAVDISRPDAAWLQIEFSEELLGLDVEIQVSSPDTGELQNFSPGLLRTWNWVTGPIPGSTARVKILAREASTVDLTGVRFDKIIRL